MNRRERRHPQRHQPGKIVATRGDGVVMAWMHPGQTAGRFTESIAGELVWDSAHGKHIVGHGGYLSLETGPRLSSARTRIVRTFLNFPTEPQPEWLWMLDSDMAWEAGALEQLLAVADPVAAPIVGGLCFGGGRESAVFPTMYVLNQVDGEATIDTLKEWPRGQAVRVDATGAACLLVHRTVFELLEEHHRGPYPWFAETWLGGTEIGEDVTFCLRARHLGMPITVHTGVKIGHVKQATLDQAAFDAARPRPYHGFAASGGDRGDSPGDLRGEPAVAGAGAPRAGAADPGA